MAKGQQLLLLRGGAVLAGTEQRLPAGLDVMRRGFAPLLVVSKSHSPTPLETATCSGAGAAWPFC